MKEFKVSLTMADGTIEEFFAFEIEFCPAEKLSNEPFLSITVPYSPNSSELMTRYIFVKKIRKLVVGEFDWSGYE